MARNSIRFGAARAAIAVDAAPPAAPTNADGTPKTVPVPGVVSLAGAVAVVVDVVPDGAGLASVGMLWWNELARVWVHDATVAPDTTAGVATRLVWNVAVGSRYAYAYVVSRTAVVAIYTGGVYQDGGA